MFATGSHDGAVRIWTKPPEPSEDAFGQVGTGANSPYPGLMRSESPEGESTVSAHDRRNGNENGLEGRAAAGSGPAAGGVSTYVRDLWSGRSRIE